MPVRCPRSRLIVRRPKIKTRRRARQVQHPPVQRLHLQFQFSLLLRAVEWPAHQHLTQSFSVPGKTQRELFDFRGRGLHNPTVPSATPTNRPGPAARLVHCKRQVALHRRSAAGSGVRVEVITAANRRAHRTGRRVTVCATNWAEPLSPPRSNFPVIVPFLMSCALTSTPDTSVTSLEPSACFWVIRTVAFASDTSLMSTCAGLDDFGFGAFLVVSFSAPARNNGSRLLDPSAFLTNVISGESITTF